MKLWATWSRRIAIGLCLIAGVLYFRFFQRNYAHYARQRAAAATTMAGRADSTRSADSQPNPIEVAVVWPQPGESGDSFLRGVHLAMTRINEAGGVRQESAQGREYRRKLNVRYFDERAGEPEVAARQSTKAGMAIARKIARDPNISAVIGHDTESIMQASVVYQNSGLVFVAPTNMDRRVTLHRFENVFRTAPQYQQVAEAMVDATTGIAGKKQLRLAILYPFELQQQLNDSGQPLTQQLTQAANSIIESYGDKVDFQVVLAQPYQRGREDYRAEIEPFLQGEQLYDVILILDVLPDAENLRRQLEDGFAHTKRDPAFEKLTLDLSSLDWSGDQALYVDFSSRSGSDDMVSRSGETVLEQAAALALSEARQSAVILASRDNYGTTLGAQLRFSIAETSDDPVSPLRLEMHRFYRPQSDSYMAVVAEVLQKKPDFVFVAGAGKPAVDLIRQLRESGLDRPVICGPDLESRIITDQELVGDQGRTYVASVFDSDSLSPKVREFVAQFQSEFDNGPVDARAAQGYQAIQLLTEAFQRGGSTDPETVAAALRLFVEDEGIFGRNRFSGRGDLLGLQIVFKQRDPAGNVNTIRLKSATPRQLAR